MSTPAPADVMQVRAPARLRGTIAIPGDKSITHRALLFNALARGTARIDGFLDSADIRSTIACLRQLGVTIEEPAADVIVVHGQGRAGLVEPSDVLDCGNSGTTIRLMVGALSTLPFLSVLTGDASLRRRPMARIVRPLRELGVDVTARADGTLPPIVLRGGAVRGDRTIEIAVASAQVKSALLLAALGADGPVTVIEPTQSRDHTERMLAAMGATVTVDGTAATLRAPEGDLRAVDVAVPGDISTAAAWIVAATLHPDADLLLTGVGVNHTRTGLLDILRAMGASIEALNVRESGGEPVADLRVRSAALHGIEIGGALIPRAIDELPLAALAGAIASGETVIRDAAELRVKESDRVATTARVLRAFGATVEERDDGLRVQGGAFLRAATIDAEGDHRVAMLGAVAGVLAGGASQVHGASAVSVSYPAFWSELSRLDATPAAERRA